MYKYLSLIVLLFTSAAYSWDGNIRGKIDRIDVAEKNNYDFRVTLKGGDGNVLYSCADNVGWSYTNEGQSNYSTYVAVLLAAKMADKEVTILTTKDAQGYCRIGYVVLH